MNGQTDNGKVLLLRDAAAFDVAHTVSLTKLWFLGDVHGEFTHIDRALVKASKAGWFPSWLIILGDVEISTKPLKEILVPLRLDFPEVKVAFIHGNHDADTHENWACLHDCSDAVALQGQVTDLDGIRVAGLGGNFMGRVWAPPSGPTFASKLQAMARGPFARCDGQKPSPKLHGAIYPDDVAKLARQRADILVTHEAPFCHKYGWEALDQLARDMRVIRTFHGHTHDDLSEQYATQRDQLGFDAREVNFRCVKNGLGELVAEPNKASGSRKFFCYPTFTWSSRSSRQSGTMCAVTTAWTWWYRRATSPKAHRASAGRGRRSSPKRSSTCSVTTSSTAGTSSF